MLLAKMRNNPRDRRIDELETVAKRFGVDVRKTGGSHFVFLHPESEFAVTVPFERPTKPIYVIQLLALLDELGADK